MADAPDNKPQTATSKRSRKPQLRVVFDTNALYVTPTSLGSASDLLRDEIASLILESKYPDLDILWYLPEVVRHERQYQMQTEALKLRGSINKIEKLLGHNLALSDKTLLDHVKTKIDEKENELGLQEIILDHSSVDWASLIHASLYRKPPFQTGEKEKGFRDALVVESFLQLFAASPRTLASCRVVLITADGPLADAVKGRIAAYSNAGVLAGVEELKGLINTLISDVSEDFIAQLKPKAEKFFFVSAEDKETLYFKEKLTDRIEEKFKAELQKTPEGTTFRRNKIWYISSPNFSRKEARRIFWMSRIEIEFEAGTVTKASEPAQLITPPLPYGAFPLGKEDYSVGNLDPGAARAFANVGDIYGGSQIEWGVNSLAMRAGMADKRTVTQKGRDIYEVLWSTEVTTSKEFKKSEVHDIRHIGLKPAPA